MAVRYAHPRGLRSALNSMASASNIRTGQVYSVTDESRLALGLSPTSYALMVNDSDARLAAIGAPASLLTTDKTSLVAALNEVILSQAASVRRYGALGNGVANDAPAINAALAANKHVYVPPGTYMLGSAITIPQSGTTLFGPGVLCATTANNAVLTAADNLTDLTISGLRLTRSVAPTTGVGLDFRGKVLDRILIENVTSEKHAIGFGLGVTAWSRVKNCIAERNSGDGFTVQNTAARSEVQWQFVDCLAQFNGGRGYLWQAVAGPAQFICGPMAGCATFANTGVGVAYVGLASCPMSDARMFNCFIGDDGNHGIYLDTYGGQHQIMDCFVEQIGQGPTGPTYSTPKSAFGCGISVTANNLEVQIIGGHAKACSYEALLLGAVRNAVVGFRGTDNGQALASGRRSGLYLHAGRVMANGCFFGNSPGGASQDYGIYGYDGAYLGIVGCDLIGNNVAPADAATNMSWCVAVGNFSRAP